MSSDQLQLADSPNLGRWKIKAKIQNQEEEAFFTVEKYVLPKFEVTIVLPGMQFEKSFLYASTHLYNRVCPSVGWSVSRSVGRSPVFRCVHASLYEGLSVRGPSVAPSVSRSVRNVFFSNRGI